MVLGAFGFCVGEAKSTANLRAIQLQDFFLFFAGQTLPTRAQGHKQF